MAGRDRKPPIASPWECFAVPVAKLQTQVAFEDVPELKDMDGAPRRCTIATPEAGDAFIRQELKKQYLARAAPPAGGKVDDHVHKTAANVEALEDDGGDPAVWKTSELWMQPLKEPEAPGKDDKSRAYPTRSPVFVFYAVPKDACAYYRSAARSMGVGEVPEAKERETKRVVAAEAT